jgi:hypothetical protein
MRMDVAVIVPHLADIAFAARWSQCALKFGELARAAGLLVANDGEPPPLEVSQALSHGL